MRLESVGGRLGRGAEIAAALFVFLASGRAGPFDLDPSREYRIINQFSGKPLKQYIDDKPSLGEYWNADGPVKVTVAKVVSGSTTYYKFKTHPHWMGAPTSSGGKLRLDSWGGNSPSYVYQWELIPYVTPEGNDYGTCYVRNRSTGEYLCDSVNTNTELNLRSPNLTNHWPTTFASLIPDDRRFIWKISPSEYVPEETLAVSQGGWTPKARKTAVLCLDAALASSPSFQVTSNGSSTVLFSGTALYWGTFWNDQHYYVLNLNDDALAVPGDYEVTCAGKQAEIYVREDVWIRPMRREGTDRFGLEEIFDDNFGFCGQWGRLFNWWPQTYLFYEGLSEWAPRNPMTHPVRWMWRDCGDSNGNGVEYEESPDEVSAPEANRSLKGAWDITDQWAHNYALDGMVMVQLAEMYRNTTDSVLRAEIAEEIEWGVDGILYRQETNGSWRQGFLDTIHWTGTTASLAAGLAAAYPVLEAEAPSLTNGVRAAMDAAWSYVTANKEDRTTWSVRGEGKLPDGSTLNKTLGGQRNLWREAYLMQAVYMYLATGESTYWNAAEAEISAGKISSSGGWVKTSGTFPGQQDGQGAFRAIATLLDFYPHASASNRSRIETMAQTCYDNLVVKSTLLDGAFGNYEARRRDWASADIWGLYKRVYAAAHLYDVLGKKYGEGMLLAQRTLDWYMGANPYDSSLLSAVGDRYVVDGWSCYHTAGRHTGFSAGSEGGTPRLKGSDSGYGGTEATVSSSLALWNALILLDKHRSDMDGVTLFSGAGYTGEKVSLPAGRYDDHQLLAYGLDLNAVSSLRVPEGYAITLYADPNYAGSSAIYDFDEPTLGSMDDQTESVIITYAPPVPPLAVTDPRPASGATPQRACVDLHWENGGNASSFNVYLNGVCLTNGLRSLFFDPGMLAYGTTYTWRVDAVNSLGTATGSVWSFTTRLRQPMELKVSDSATAEQSTGLWGDAYPASNGLNGDWNDFTHTDETTPDNYWQMNLDQDYDVSRIKFRNRTSSCCGNRLNNSYVMLLDASLDCIWSNRIVGATYGEYLEYNLPAGLSGRHVRIGLVNGEKNAEDNYYVSIAEAEAYTVIPVDGDGDGLDDDWETQYGTDPKTADDLSSDLDADGRTLWQEYVASTDPFDADSRFVLQWRRSPTALDVVFDTSRSRRYTLQWSPDLATNLWTDQSGWTNRQGTGAEMVFSDQTNAAFRCYRVKAIVP